MIGHTLGAAGAVEAVTTVLALRDGVFLRRSFRPMRRTHPMASISSPRLDERLYFPWRCPTPSRSAATTHPSCSLATIPGSAGVVGVDGTPVVITGIAAIAADAKDSAEVRDLLREWRPAYGTQRVALEGYGDFPVAEIPEKHLTRGVNPQMLRRIDNLGRRSAVVVADLLRERKLSRDEAARTG